MGLGGVSFMPFRRRVVALVVAVVANMVTGLLVTPLAICQMRDGQMAMAGLVCTCNHSPDGQCAMHKHHGSGSTNTTSTRNTNTNTNKWCAGCQDSADYIMTAFTGFAAPLIAPIALAPPEVRVRSVRAFSERPLDTFSPPLSPPPRLG